NCYPVSTHPHITLFCNFPYTTLFRSTSSGVTLFQWADRQAFTDEESLYEQAGLPFIIPEMREGLSEWAWVEKYSPDELVTWDDLDRKSTRLNSSHVKISYAVFCLKKK